MKKVLTWIWEREIVSAFLTGLFVVLPLGITLWIMDGVAGILRKIVGPETYVGEGLRSLGLHFVANDTAATVIGWSFVVVAIWLLGLLVKSTARFRIRDKINRAINRVPLIRMIYGPVSEVVGMVRHQDCEGVKSMSVVYCTLGEKEAAGFLALLASEGLFRFGDHDCHLVYLPTSPLVISGGLVFVPATAVHRVDMSIEALLQVYVSMGVMAAKMVPGSYCVPEALPETEAKSAQTK